MFIFYDSWPLWCHNYMCHSLLEDFFNSESFLCSVPIDQLWWYTEQEGSGCIRTASSSVTADLRRPAVDNPAAGVIWDLGMGAYDQTLPPLLTLGMRPLLVPSILQGLTGDGEGADSQSQGDCGRLMSGWSSSNFTNLTPHSPTL